MTQHRLPDRVRLANPQFLVHGGSFKSEHPENASGWPLWVCIVSAAVVAALAAYFWFAW